MQNYAAHKHFFYCVHFGERKSKSTKVKKTKQNLILDLILIISSLHFLLLNIEVGSLSLLHFHISSSERYQSSCLT